jgi:MoxR-like ATPase
MSNLLETLAHSSEPHTDYSNPPPINTTAFPWIATLRAEIARVLIGQHDLVERMLIALLTNGHVLLEGVPGLAKTLAVRTLATSLHAKFKRIQFTPDLLPADLIGTMVYNPKEGSFSPRLGPVFANLVLADEINRAPAKVQSALLEAMQERQVTIGDHTYPLPNPFLVLATQNPIEQEGTYTLPEAQLDRFLFKVKVTYPTQSEERSVLDAMATSTPKLEVNPVVDIQEVIEARNHVNKVHISEALRDYIVTIIQATRDPSPYAPHLTKLIRSGSSPRGTINLALAAKALALLSNRNYVVPQDIKALALDTLCHRILLSYEAEAEMITAEQIIIELLEKIPVP